MSVRTQTEVKAAPTPTSSITPVRTGLLQRKCACGGNPGLSGECAECRKKRLTLQRRAVSTAEPSEVPPIVHEVLRSPGQPLDPATRAFMESRFGHDFSRVRVHTDAQAAQSAIAVNAQAYAVGHDVVFGAGWYAPHTSEGKRLLAHELTHTIQQSQGRESYPPIASALQVSDPNDPYEQDADVQTTRVLDGSMGNPVQVQERRGVSWLQRQVPTPVLVPVHPPTNVGICGPDVTTELSDALSSVKTVFAGWTQQQKNDACNSLDTRPQAAYAWDISQLHMNDWIYLQYAKKGKSCATTGADPPCTASVQVGTDCYYAGSANYVVFGAMCKLCHDYFTGTPDAVRFEEPTMLSLIGKWKFWGVRGANIIPAMDWASAGYNGWPATTPPAGDRSNCLPTCPHPNVFPSFTVRWVPHLNSFIPKLFGIPLYRGPRRARQATVRPGYLSIGEIEDEGGIIRPGPGPKY